MLFRHSGFLVATPQPTGTFDEIHPTRSSLSQLLAATFTRGVVSQSTVPAAGITAVLS